MTYSPFDRAAFDRRVREIVAPLMILTSADGRSSAPRALRGQLSTEQWMSLSTPDRHAHVKRQAIAALAVEDEPLKGSFLSTLQAANRLRGRRRNEALALRAAAAETAAIAPVPDPSIAVPPERPGRYFVSCAGGCGAMLPARGPRPVVAWHGGACRPRVKKRRPGPTR